MINTSDVRCDVCGGATTQLMSSTAWSGMRCPDCVRKLSGAFGVSDPGEYFIQIMEPWEVHDETSNIMALTRLSRFLSRHGQRDRHESSVECAIQWIREMIAERSSDDMKGRE